MFDEVGNWMDIQHTHGRASIRSIGNGEYITRTKQIEMNSEQWYQSEIFKLNDDGTAYKIINTIYAKEIEDIIHEIFETYGDV